MKIVKIHSLLFLKIKVFYGGLFPFEQDNCLLRIKEYHYHSNPKSTRPRLNKVLKSRYLKSAICDPRLRKLH
ncbi:unnamed protein product [Rhizophagus irregularis]|uniref:Uncharacterized protein n=1 Tax=Rhizophagus irregularis TaxID=588596 RepID=A0A915ZJU1_9GLOM|nr:unnamed protein product [Rhizophagus irregularis]